MPECSKILKSIQSSLGPKVSYYGPDVQEDWNIICFTISVKTKLGGSHHEELWRIGITFSLRVFKATYNFQPSLSLIRVLGINPWVLLRAQLLFSSHAFVVSGGSCKQDFSEESLNDRSISLQVWKVTNDPPVTSSGFFCHLIFLYRYMVTATVEFLLNWRARLLLTFGSFLQRHSNSCSGDRTGIFPSTYFTWLKTTPNSTSSNFKWGWWYLKISVEYKVGFFCRVCKCYCT